jgi:DNA-binding response OmpR family regulator
MHKGRILFADNNERFLKFRSEFLESAGYEVIKAYTYEDAERLLRDMWFHLAILDIRLLNDDDDLDISGLRLAQDDALRAVPKVMLTGFPNVAAVREALRPEVDRLPPAVDFVSKSDGVEALTSAIERAFEKHVRINRNLDIRWDQRERLSFPHLVNLIQLDLPNEILVQRADELEDLVRRLFYDYQQVRMGRLLWDADGRFCLPVLAASPEGTTDAKIVICGEPNQIRQERELMARLAPETLQGTRVYKEETPHFGATAYVLSSADAGTVQTLRDLFHGGGVRLVRSAIEDLTSNVLTAWHKHGHAVAETSDLVSLYRHWAGLNEDVLPYTEVECRTDALIQAVRPFIGAVEIERGDGKICFRFPNESPLTYPDPVAAAHAPLPICEAPVVCKPSPGGLSADNVLVDAEQKTRLTDFAHAGQAPQWWDFVCLEAAIRFDLSYTAELSAWHEFEKCLVTPDRLHTRLQAGEVIASLKTSIAVIEQIRRQAGSEAGPDPAPYNAGMLVWAVAAVAQYEPRVLYTQADLMRGVHLLLAGAMIAERLGDPTDIPPPGGRLRLDEDGKVWRGERRVAVLTGLRLELLRCLYERAGQIVDNRTIVNTVYGEEYDAADRAQKQRTRQEISRLRAEIEPDTSCQLYLRTVRGKGYRLHVGGELEE